MLLGKSSEHSSRKQYAGDIDELKSTQHLQSRQQKASAAMNKTEGHKQSATAQDSCGRGERARRPQCAALDAGNSQQQERHQQTRILKPLPAGKEKIRTAEGRAIVGNAGICMTRG